MTTFKIVRTGERSNDIEADGQVVARVLNRDTGWMAYRVAKTDRVNALGPVYEPIGEGVRASKFVNLVDGGQRIAAELGLA